MPAAGQGGGRLRPYGAHGMPPFPAAGQSWLRRLICLTRSVPFPGRGSGPPSGSPPSAGRRAPSWLWSRACPGPGRSSPPSGPRCLTGAGRPLRPVSTAETAPCREIPAGDGAGQSGAISPLKPAMRPRTFTGFPPPRESPRNGPSSVFCWRVPAPGAPAGGKTPERRHPCRRPPCRRFPRSAGAWRCGSSPIPFPYRRPCRRHPCHRLPCRQPPCRGKSKDWAGTAVPPKGLSWWCPYRRPPCRRLPCQGGFIRGRCWNCPCPPGKGGTPKAGPCCWSCPKNAEARVSRKTPPQIDCAAVLRFSSLYESPRRGDTTV